MKIYKTTEASEYLGVSINTLKTLANNGKVNVVSLKELKMRETDSYEDGITKKIYLSHHEA